jgi:type II secretory pathway pseudopilin PulG
LRRIMVVLMIAAVVVAVVATAGPAMAQDPKAERKAERKAARQAAKQAQKAQNPGAQKQLPKSGGIPIDASLLGLSAGALLVGGGLVVRRAVRR